MIRGWTAAFAAALLAAVAALAIASSADAAVTELKAGSATVAPGGSVTISITVDATAPGVGAYGVNVSYDGSVVDATACTSEEGQCNTEFGTNTVRINGATTQGITGSDAVLGTITFTAVGAAGDSTALTIDAGALTLSDPEGTTLSVTPTNGTITIAQPTASPSPSPTGGATGSPTGAATATATPRQLPATGGPGGDDTSTMTLLLAITGLAVVAGGAWAVARARRVS